MVFYSAEQIALEAKKSRNCWAFPKMYLEFLDASQTKGKNKFQMLILENIS